jgi:hypothetical protein
MEIAHLKVHPNLQMTFNLTLDRYVDNKNISLIDIFYCYSIFVNCVSLKTVLDSVIPFSYANSN